MLRLWQQSATLALKVSIKQVQLMNTVASFVPRVPNTQTLTRLAHLAHPESTKMKTKKAMLPANFVQRDFNTRREILHAKHVL